MALRSARAGGLSLWSGPAITACPKQHNRHCKDAKRLPHQSAFAKRAAQRCKQAFQDLSPPPAISTVAAALNTHGTRTPEDVSWFRATAETPGLVEHDVITASDPGGKTGRR